MSFLDDAIEFGKVVFGGDSTGATLARTAALAGAVYLVNNNGKSNNLPSAANTNAVDPGVRLQVGPNSENKIPVVYGSAHLGGIITDAQISNNNSRMHYVIAISEKTGTLLSDSSDSVFTFNDIYWNDQRIVFKSDGITANYTVDKDSNVDYSIQDLVKVYCYRGNSTSPVVPTGYTNGSLSPAYSIVPTWTSNHAMTNIVFAVVEVNYNKDRNVTNIPTVKFHITNSMTQPGDCIYDYMTNSVYGAGIPVEEINV
jgi:hypothetical protein